MPADSRRSREQTWIRDQPWRPARSLTRARTGDHELDVDDPVHRYGIEYAARYLGRHWDEVEPELRRRWDRYEHRGDHHWDEVKHSVREAYQRAAENEATRD